MGLPSGKLTVGPLKSRIFHGNEQLEVSSGGTTKNYNSGKLRDNYPVVKIIIVVK